MSVAPKSFEVKLPVDQEESCFKGILLFSLSFWQLKCNFYHTVALSGACRVEQTIPSPLTCSRCGNEHLPRNETQTRASFFFVSTRNLISVTFPVIRTLRGKLKERMTFGFHDFPVNDLQSHHLLRIW